MPLPKPPTLMDDLDAMITLSRWYQGQMVIEDDLRAAVYRVLEMGSDLAAAPGEQDVEPFIDEAVGG